MRRRTPVDQVMAACRWGGSSWTGSAATSPPAPRDELDAVVVVDRGAVRVVAKDTSAVFHADLADVVGYAVVSGGDSNGGGDAVVVVQTVRGAAKERTANARIAGLDGTQAEAIGRALALALVGVRRRRRAGGARALSLARRYVDSSDE